MLIIDRERGKLYELFSARPVAGGRSWEAGSARFRPSIERPTSGRMDVRRCGGFAGSAGLGAL